LSAPCPKNKKLKKKKLLDDPFVKLSIFLQFLQHDEEAAAPNKLIFSFTRLEEHMLALLY
jgi:hypothetical protein